jgi:hypothetical protein
MVNCTAVSERILVLGRQVDSKLEDDTLVVGWCSKQASFVGVDDGLGTIAVAEGSV